MTIATRSKDPAAVPFIGVFLRVENTCFGQIKIVNLCVLSVHMEDAIAQYTDSLYGIDSLPEHMAGIVVTSDAVSRNRTKLQHGLGAIHDEARMHLNCDLHTVIFCKLAVIGPIGRNFLLPLPVEHIEVFRRPRTSDPIRELCVIAVTRTSGEVDNHGDS